VRNSRTWTAASCTAALIWALANFAHGVAAERPGESALLITSSSNQAPSLSTRSRYLTDLTLIKNATLESEAVFFDRLEKQRKIDDAAKDLNNARIGLDKVVQDLNPPGVKELDQAVQEIERANSQLASVKLNLEAAYERLVEFHERRTAEAVAIAEGRLDGAPLAGKIRRHLKVAERDLDRLSQTLTGPVNSLHEMLAKARKKFTVYLGALNEDDPRLSKFAEALKAIDGADAALAQAEMETKALLAELKNMRREFLPECITPPAPILAPADQAPADVRAVEEACQGGSRMLLENSKALIIEIAEARVQVAGVDQTSGIQQSLDSLRSAIESGIRLVESGDSAASKIHEKVRNLHAEAMKRLDLAEKQLDETRSIPTQDYPGETKPCACCGNDVVRTRKVLDPACICMLTNQSMLRAEMEIRRALELTQEMSVALRQKGPVAGAVQPPGNREPIDELSRENGVLELLLMALKRGAEFRNQEFDLYPGDSQPQVVELSPREFPPTVYHYAAREIWHYPLYFGDLSAERYGHHFGCIQPVISYGKFVADLVMLPYNLCLDSPYSIQYDHGLYRPGDCVPHLIYLPRWDRRAAFFQAAVWTGLFYTP